MCAAETCAEGKVIQMWPDKPYIAPAVYVPYKRPPTQGELNKKARNKIRKVERQRAKKFATCNCLLCGQNAHDKYQAGVGTTRVGLFLHHTQLFSEGGSVKNGGVVVTLCWNCHRKAHTVNGKFWWKHINQDLAKVLEGMAAKLNP